MIQFKKFVTHTGFIPTIKIDGELVVYLEEIKFIPSADCKKEDATRIHLVGGFTVDVEETIKTVEKRIDVAKRSKEYNCNVRENR